MVSMGVQACSDPGARTPISARGSFLQYERKIYIFYAERNQPIREAVNKKKYRVLAGHFQVYKDD